MPAAAPSKPFTPVPGKLGAACSCPSFVAQQRTTRAAKQRKIVGQFSHQHRALKAAAAAVVIETEYPTQTETPSTISDPASTTRHQDAGSENRPDTAHLGTHMTSLHIRNFALIEEEHVQFKPGLNVITGGSGAGKSVLVEAFGQVLGAAATDHCVRPPATTATIEASVYLSSTAQATVAKLLRCLGMPRAISPASQQLMLRRELTNHDDSVRSRCFVNGIATSLRVLRELGNALVDVNGQHAAVSIRDDATQLALLDRVAGTEAAAASFGAALQQLQDVEAQLADIASLGSEEEREELQQTIHEVQKARLEEGEERQLRAELRQLDARRASVERAGLFHQALAGDGSSNGFLEELQTLEGHVTAMLDTEEAFAQHSASDASGQDEDASAGLSDADVAESIGVLDEAVCGLMEARSLLRKAESQVATYARKYRYLQQEYDDAADRLHTVERLLKQYQCSTSEELLAEVDQAQADLDKWYHLEGKEEELKVQQATQLRQLQEAAVQLSMQRREGGRKLKAAVESCLHSLAMAESHFAVQLAWQPAQQGTGLLMPEELSRQADQQGGVSYGAHSCGLDHVTFMLAPGPQEPLRPLSGVASGGESARIMLAMKAAPLAIADTGLGEEGNMPPPLMVLDELDTGVGARLGKAVGSLLRGLSAQPSARNSPGQILCVSHLPQVAAYADHHLCVRKAVDSEGRVKTAVDALLDTSDRAHEVAAMLGLDYRQAMQMLEEVRAESGR